MSQTGSDLQALALALGEPCPRLDPAADPANPAPMTRALQRIRLAFGDSGALAASPRSARALLAFRSGDRLRFIDLKYLCHAVDRPNPWDGRRLLQDAQLLQRLLQQVDAWQGEPRRFRQCYRGLLQAYSGAAAGPGRTLLGDYLRRYRQYVAASQPPLEWTRELARHPALADGKD